MIEAFLKKQGKSQVSNLSYHLNEFEKKRPKISRASRRKEIKFRGEINEVETEKTIEKINGTKRFSKR